MGKRSSFRWLVPGALALLAGGGALLFPSCGTKEPAPRSLRAHLTLHGGVSHAGPAKQAGRYCVRCHGADLGGGTHFEPGCNTCHGQTWLVEPGAASVAPSDHTVDNQGYLHGAGLMDPQTNCTACHGADLNGDLVGDRGTPGCFLCHEQRW